MAAKTAADMIPTPTPRATMVAVVAAIVEGLRFSPPSIISLIFMIAAPRMMIAPVIISRDLPTLIIVLTVFMGLLITLIPLILSRIIAVPTEANTIPVVAAPSSAMTIAVSITLDGDRPRPFSIMSDTLTIIAPRATVAIEIKARDPATFASSLAFSGLEISWIASLFSLSMSMSSMEAIAMPTAAPPIATMTAAVSATVAKSRLRAFIIFVPMNIIAAPRIRRPTAIAAMIAPSCSISCGLMDLSMLIVSSMNELPFGDSTSTSLVSGHGSHFFSPLMRLMS